MNKYLLSVLALSLPLTAQASWYGGVNLGANIMSVAKNLAYPIDSAPATHANFTSAYTGFHGQIFAGYDHPLTERYSVALEGNLDFFTGRSRYQITKWFINNNAQATEKFSHGGSLFLMPQYHLAPNIRLFAGPGVTMSRFEVPFSGSAANVGVSGEIEKWLTGYGFKAGTGLRVCDNVDLVLTYQYTNYNSLTRTAREPLSFNLLNMVYNPYAQLVMVGLSYSPEARVMEK